MNMYENIYTNVYTYKPTPVYFINFLSYILLIRNFIKIRNDNKKIMIGD